MLMLLYDVDKAYWKKGLLFLFPAGALLLLCATLGLLWGRAPGTQPLWRCLFGGLAAEAALLLLYTQLVALPAGTFGKKAPALCAAGLYSRCRHPGFWPFLLLYLSLWLYTGTKESLAAGLLFCILDFLYITAQDLWLFPRYIQGYSAYKQAVPFLLPGLTGKKR